MAAAQGTARFQLPNGRIEAVNFYAADSANTLVKFDESKVAVAGSPDAYVAKGGGISKLIDVCFTSDTATPTSVQILIDGTPTGDILDITAQLASVVNRPNPYLSFNAGAKFQMMLL